MKISKAAFLNKKRDAWKQRATDERVSEANSLSGVGGGFQCDANGNMEQHFYDTRKDRNGNTEQYFYDQDEDGNIEQYFYNPSEEAGESENHILIVDNGQTNDDIIECHEKDLEANIIAAKPKGTGENTQQAETRAKTLALLSFLITDENGHMHANSKADAIKNTTARPTSNTTPDPATNHTTNSSSNELPLFTIIAVFGLGLMIIPAINVINLITCFYWWADVMILSSIVLLLMSVKKYRDTTMSLNWRAIGTFLLLFLLWGLSFVWAFWWTTFEVPWHAFMGPPTIITVVLGILYYRKNDVNNFFTGYWVSILIFIGCYFVGAAILSISIFGGDIPLIQEKYGIDHLWRLTSIGNALIVTLAFFIRIAITAPNKNSATSRDATIYDWRSSYTSTASTNDTDGIAGQTATQKIFHANANITFGTPISCLYVHLIAAPLGFPIIVWIKSVHLSISLAVSLATIFIVFVGLKIIKNATSSPNSTACSTTTTKKYPEDSYSFLAFYHPIHDTNLFFFGFVVFLFQFFLLILMVLSVAVPNLRTTGDVDNPGLGWIGGMFPANASPLVQATQILSIMAFIFFPDASLTDITNAIELFPKVNQANPNYKSRGLALSCTLRLLQGVVAIFAVFLLVMTSSTVIDIVLNFTAINFISTLDNRAFSLAEMGKYGPMVEKAAKTIKNAHVPERSSPSTNHRRYKYGIFVSSLILYAAFLGVRGAQDNSKVWVSQIVRVEFEDIERSHFSGCYHINENSMFSRRYAYDSDGNNEENAVLGYCKKEQRWLFFVEADDPCDAYGTGMEIAHSEKTDSFDIQSSTAEDWFTPYNTPIGSMYFVETNGAETCDWFPSNGKCELFLNNFNYQYDGGDCCATTCDGPSCGVVHRSDERKYPSCNDPDMVPITIYFEDDAPFEKEQNEFLKLDCISGRGTHSVFKIKPGGEGKASEPAMVGSGSNCTFYVDNNDDRSFPIEYKVYHGYNYHDIKEDSQYEIFHSTTGNKMEKEFFIVPSAPLFTRENMLIPSNLGVLKSIPTEIGLLTNVTHLDLYDNAFTGTLPTEIGLMTNLEFIDLSFNWLTGTLPSEIGLLTSLSSINIKFNSFTGSLPSEIGSLKWLASINSYKNPLTGTLPSEIGLLTSLTYLDLDRNSFTGTLPSEICSLPRLTYLNIENSNLIGALPSEIGLLTRLTHLDLYKNEFSSSIPSEIGLLTSLVLLDIQINKLTGTLPSEIGRLTNLVEIDLDENAISGSLPSEIGLMSNLMEMDLKKNRFTGTLPPQIGHLTNLVELDLGSNSLTGSLPSEIRMLTNLQIRELDENYFIGSLASEFGIKRKENVFEREQEN